MRVRSATPLGVFAWGLLLAGALLAPSGCTTSGHGKSAKPTWKVFKTEHPQAAPSDPIRSGGVELRVSKVFLEDNHTVFVTSYWRAVIRGTIVSPEALPLSALSDAFTLIGTSGQVYPAQVRSVGPHGANWQWEQRTGKPTYLPANVPGELEIMARVGDNDGHDELAAFTFRGAQVALPR